MERKVIVFLVYHPRLEQALSAAKKGEQLKHVLNPHFGKCALMIITACSMYIVQSSVS